MSSAATAVLAEDVARANVDRATPSAQLPLNVRGLVFEAGGKRIIDELDLDLASDGVTVLMGPNGAGKSVLLRLLHGLLEPARGSIHWAGRAPDDAVRKRQALVFQRPVLLRRSVAANLRFVLRLRAVADRADRLERMLALAGLSHLARQPARLLSGGEQQRLALARALALEPEVLLLDEPTASLDPVSVMAIEDLIATARRNGTKVILVTHDPGQARRLADDVVFIHHGKIEEVSPAGRFFQAPASDAARAYLDGRILL